LLFQKSLSGWDSPLLSSSKLSIIVEEPVTDTGRLFQYYSMIGSRKESGVLTIFVVYAVVLEIAYALRRERAQVGTVAVSVGRVPARLSDGGYRVKD
jgi:hypothetical protein